MKTRFLIVGAIVVMASCNTQPQADKTISTDSTKIVADTTGLAEFQTMKAQNELGVQNSDEKLENNSSSKTVKKTTSVSNHSSSSNTSNSNSTSSSGSTQKKGWSKTAKGAVIGGVAGAAGGAIINKKNRAAGAVIGGVIGAGTGAVIGNQKDKKDGRH